MSEVAALEPPYWARELPADRGIAEVAGLQHGVVAHRQLALLGMGRRAIQHRVETGRLHQIHVGVYAVGHRVLSGRARWMAAVLAAGLTALLSYRSGAAHLALLATATSRIDVTVPGTSRAGPANVIVHRTRRLDPEDRIVHDGIPVTSVARTLVDLAAVVRIRQLERAVETAERLEVFDLAALDRVLARSRGRRGIRNLRSVLGTYRESAFTRSELERRVLDLAREIGLGAPAANKWIAGGEADLVWEEEKLVVELDTPEFHGTQAAFERDRKRDIELQLAGFRVIRPTGLRVQQEPEVVKAEMEVLLRRAQAQNHPPAP